MSDADDEKSTLLYYLEYQRNSVRSILDGLSEEAWHTSVVQGFLSSQSTSAAQSHLTTLTHLPPLQLSVVQTLPSSQVPPSSPLCWQSSVRSQVSDVQGFSSSHAG